MDLRHPLRTVIPSRDWAVLEVLTATQSGLGASQIAHLSHVGSRTGQASILNRLVDHGLVLAEAANLGFVYRFNRDHLLAPAILQIARIRAKLLVRLTAEVEQLVPAPIHASVFGSFARGEATEDGDIDVLLLAASDHDVEAWDNHVEIIQKQVYLWTGNRCSCLSLSVRRAQQYFDISEPIVANWIRDGVLLSGRPLGRLLDDQSTAGARPPLRARSRQTGERQ